MTMCMRYIPGMESLLIGDRDNFNLVINNLKKQAVIMFLSPLTASWIEIDTGNPLFNSVAITIEISYHAERQILIREGVHISNCITSVCGILVIFCINVICHVAVVIEVHKIIREFRHIIF